MASWKDQDGATLLTFSSRFGGDHLLVAIDKLDTGHYRLTVGNLFDFREVMWTTDLELMLRKLNDLCNCEGQKRTKRLIDELSHDYPKPTETP